MVFDGNLTKKLMELPLNVYVLYRRRCEVFKVSTSCWSSPTASFRCGVDLRASNWQHRALRCRSYVCARTPTHGAFAPALDAINPGGVAGSPPLNAGFPRFSSGFRGGSATVFIAVLCVLKMSIIITVPCDYFRILAAAKCSANVCCKGSNSAS